MHGLCVYWILHLSPLQSSQQIYLVSIADDCYCACPGVVFVHLHVLLLFCATVAAVTSVVLSLEICV